MQWKYDNCYDSFMLNVGSFLESREIILSDLTDATYMVKSSDEDTDEEALATLTLASGLTPVSGATRAEDQIAVQFGSSDFGTGKLEITNGIRNAYYVGFGIKTAGDLKYLEATLSDDRLEIMQDFIRG